MVLYGRGVQSDSLVAERLLRLPIVDSVKWVWKGDEEIDIPREENDTTRFMPIDKPEKSLSLLCRGADQDAERYQIA